ncbi:MAG: hypothetical protein ACKV2Q_05215 [Planctomycetaceae bacterium]
MRNTFRVACLCALLSVGFLALNGHGQDGPPGKSQTNVGSFINELMRLEIQKDSQQLAIWMPREFFIAAAHQEGTSLEQARTDTAFLDAYQIVLVQCGKSDIVGNTKYSSEAEVRDRAVLLQPDGTEIKPLTRIPPLVLAVTTAMKTMMANEGDEGSKNMHVILFPSKSKTGKPIVNVTAQDKLTLRLKAAGTFAETTIVWRTPFDALTANTPCRKCSESLSGKWSYCPYCGNKK